MKLLEYCRANNWAGYDPYDALNSPIFKYLPFLDSRWPRIALTQVLKRSPINFRPLLLIPKTENPKAIALFLTAFLKLKKLDLLENDDLIELMVQKLITLRSPVNSITCNAQLVTRNSQRNNPSNVVNSTNSINPTNPSNPSNPTNPMNPINPYWCWGYSFPWQTRTVLVPRGAPNLVCTTFVANALLDAYEYFSQPECPHSSSEAYLLPPTLGRSSAPGEPHLQPSACGALCLDMAVSAAEYLLNELYWTEGDSVASFSYPLRGIRSLTHNANFLGAALLCRVAKHSGEKRFLEPALKVARYSAAKQHNDGSWEYGEHSTQRWVDNFHTGYNLCALQAIGEYAGTSEFEPHIRQGFEFYRKNFFVNGGAPKYFHNRTHPIDIHSVAQSIITLMALRDLDENNIRFALSVFDWAMTNMRDDQGYFYYQVLRFSKIRISYLRWSQAWVLLALSELLEECVK